MKVRRLKNEEQKSKEETEKKKLDLQFCDEVGLFFRKPEQGELECVCERGDRCDSSGATCHHVALHRTPVQLL